MDDEGKIIPEQDNNMEHTINEEDEDIYGTNEEEEQYKGQ